MRRTRPRPTPTLAIGLLASACLAACGSPGDAGHAGSGTGASTSSASATSAGAGGATSGGAGGPTASGTSATSTGAGGAASSASTASGGGSSSGATTWHPTTTQPIHFHWMIGGFTTADLLSGQAGQVVYDIDGEGATAADVAAIHAAGAVAVCYVDVGTLESWRSDASQFPADVIGPADAGWQGESWLLVTAANQPTLLALMKARFVSWCQAKGFDAIEPDNLDAWANISGVSETDNLAYDLAIASLAHGLSFSIGLKNIATEIDPSQYATFTSAFDWALNEQCYEYTECDTYTAAGSFLPAGKAVFDVEYNVAPTCAQADQVQMNAQRTDLDLVGASQSGYQYTPCVPDDQTTW